MNETIQLTIQTIDAKLRVPSNEYDEMGKIIGPNPNFEQQLKDAQGKIFVRCIAEHLGQKTGVESPVMEQRDLQPLIGDVISVIGKSIAKRLSTIDIGVTVT